ncbi:putative disease resistance protein RGA1 [Bienertia sinuspersici]
MSPNLLKFLQQYNIHETVKKWSKTLLRIQAVISDAEHKQMTNKLVTLWLDELQDLAYDLDDILDEISTESQLYESPLNDENSSGIVGNFFPVNFTALSPRKLSFSHNIKSKIESISKRLLDIVSQKDELGLLEFGLQNKNEAKVWQKRESTSLVCEPHVYGRDEEKDKIIDLLLNEGEICSNFCVIPLLEKVGLVRQPLLNLYSMMIE